MANLHGCAGAENLVCNVDELRAKYLELVAEAGLVAVGECFHQFGEGGGVTGVVVLAESHLSVHTWPEKRFVTLDVFVCNLNCDNRAKARQLFAALVALFQPANQHAYEVERA
ncbi:MAG: adenosylmethionine decarboxylase [Sulfuricella sp.]|nr:adenosylmethionine decarboxylase [Sulfuricella sp.]